MLRASTRRRFRRRGVRLSHPHPMSMWMLSLLGGHGYLGGIVCGEAILYARLSKCREGWVADPRQQDGVSACRSGQSSAEGPVRLKACAGWGERSSPGVREKRCSGNHCRWKRGLELVGGGGADGELEEARVSKWQLSAWASYHCFAVRCVRWESALAAPDRGCRLARGTPAQITIVVIKRGAAQPEAGGLDSLHVCTAIRRWLTPRWRETRRNGGWSRAK